MAKRGYKLQEFVAHSVNVNCLTIGKKACRLFVTGGDDHEVNLWSIGKPTSLMNLCGHTASVESVAFDSAEVLVLGGASTGAIKLWDLEGAKMIRTLTGHRSNCTAVEFHPLAEFFASGSMDTNLKIWDNRKKGCIHTYKGHTRGISTVRFSPDGRWVVSGGFDNIVKVWDLTAGKLLHDFKFHEGHITSIDFHPLEFLLATGSADRSVKFWDLETFELIGSSRPEDSGVQAITFHPDGRTLFCGFDDSLKVYSWEPVICHDIVDMGWSALGDLCINDGKILGCSLYQNSVGVWVADASRIDPYGVGVPEQSFCTEKKFNPQGSLASDKVGIGVRSTSGFRSTSPDCEVKEIKTIYVDSTGGNPITSQKIGFSNSPKVILPLDCEEMCDLQSEKHSPSMGVREKSNGQSFNKSCFVPGIVPQESPAGKDSPISGRDSVTFSRTKPGMLLRPAHVQRPPSTKYDAERLFTAVETGSFNNMKSELNGAVYPNSQPKLVSSDGAIKTTKEKNSQIKSVAGKMLSPSHVRRPSNSKFGAERLSMAVEPGIFNNMKSELDSVRDPNSQTKLISSDGTVKTSEEKDPQVKSVTEKKLRPSHVQRQSNSKFDGERLSMAVESGSFNNMKSELDSARDPNSQTPLVSSDGAVKPSEENDSHIKCVTEKIEKILSPQRPPNQENCDESLNCSQGITSVKFVNGVAVVPGRTRTLVERFERREKFNSNEDQAANITPQTRLISNEDQATNVNPHARLDSNEDQATSTTPHTRLNSSESQSITPHMRPNGSEDQATDLAPCMRLSCCDEQATNTPPCTRPNSSEGLATNTPRSMKFRRNGDHSTNNTPDMRLSSNKDHATTSVTRVRFKNNADQATTTTTRVRFKNNADQATTTTTRVRFKNNADQATIYTTRVRFRNNPHQATTTATRLCYKNNEDQATINTPHVIVEKEEPQISGRDMTSANDGQVIENLMQTHDVFTSTLRSRLTKLQVVRHFWERKDIKGAINALRKLLDHSVQADTISVLMEKMELLNLDLFSCLLPVLTGLLDSKIEKHASISLEMLLKLVVVFSPVICPIVSAPPAVGVDLHAEQRQECCNQYLLELQKIQKILPVLIRRGGSLAKGAIELNLVLEES